MNRQNTLDRFVHRFALGSRRFRKFCFKRECDRNDYAYDRNRANLFVAGVARSGSTALLERLYASDEFASTTYAMMPFVMAPGIAKLFSRIHGKNRAGSERFHGDGIAISLDSPEALDGIFWNTWLAPFDGRLLSRELTADTLRDYAMFIENLLRTSSADRYLCKMNQDITLVESLAGYFRNSIFLVPYRDPLAQSASLLRQHLNFSRLSGYEKTYLQWLGHHEFGMTHRPFHEADTKAQTTFSTDDRNYWLQQWKYGYSYLSGLAAEYPNLIPVAYETMARSPSFWTRISGLLDIDVKGDLFEDRNDASGMTETDVDVALYNDCRSLYQELSRLSEHRLCL